MDTTGQKISLLKNRINQRRNVLTGKTNKAGDSLQKKQSTGKSTQKIETRENQIMFENINLTIRQDKIAI